MKKHIFVVLCVLTALCLLTACQPTPEVPVVVNKNDSKLEEKMQETLAPAQAYEAPEHWSETEDREKLKIVIDADVTMPDVSRFPVVKLEPATFSQERVDELVHYFAGDAKLYLPHVRTKADIDEEIVLAKRGQEIDGEFEVTEDTLAWVEELEKMREKAPDDSPIISTDTTLTYERDEYGKEVVERGKNFLSAMFQNADGDEGSIWVSNYLGRFSRASHFSCSKHQFFTITETMYQSLAVWDETEEEAGWTGAGVLFDQVPITKEDAEAQAMQVISDLGIDNMMLIKSEKAVSLDAPEMCGYQLEFARQSGGIPLFWFNGGGYSREEEPPQYSPPFTEENVTIFVNKEGVRAFLWSGPANVVETVSENVELLPFEDIQNALKDQIFYKKSFNLDGYGMSDYTVTVNSAELRMGYIGVKDNDNQALMVPVWVFENSFSFDNSTLGKTQSYPDDTYVLNAIDGGVIEMRRD